MGRVGRILPIKREYSKSLNTMEACLAEKGFTRFPGTTLKIVPAKASNGKYITGMDPEALYIRKMPKEAQQAEIDRVTALFEELTHRSDLDLSPKSPYFKDMYNSQLDQSARATIVRLKDDVNVFDLEDDQQAITFAWLRVHPLIARSWEAWERGEYDPQVTKFYVADEEVENEILYKKKQLVNQAIVTLTTMSLEDRKRVARLLGLPVRENTKENVVFNLLDNYIKDAEVKSGKFVGQSPLRAFNTISSLDAKTLTVRDLIEQAIQLSIYREDSDGTIREGGREIYKSSTEMALDISKTKNQDKLVALEERVRAKKLAEYA